jgi:hypothetical protein
LRVSLRYGERSIDSWKIFLKGEPFGIRVGEYTHLPQRSLRPQKKSWCGSRFLEHAVKISTWQ